MNASDKNAKVAWEKRLTACQDALRDILSWLGPDQQPGAAQHIKAIAEQALSPADVGESEVPHMPSARQSFPTIMKAIKLAGWGPLLEDMTSRLEAALELPELVKRACPANEPVDSGVLAQAYVLAVTLTDGTAPSPSRARLVEMLQGIRCSIGNLDADWDGIARDIDTAMKEASDGGK